MDFVGGVGYVNIDMIYSGIPHLPTVGEEVYSNDFGVYLGGGVPGTLINTARLGIPSRILTFIGQGFFPDFARSELEKSGAEVIDLCEGGMPIVISSTMLCCGDRSFMTYAEPRKPLTDAQTERIYAGLRGAKIVNMNGGFLEIYRELKKDGTILIFDTGWEDDLSLDKYRDYIEIADYYLPNRKEALKITGASCVEEAARILKEHFAEGIVKLDADGCMICDADGTRIIPAVPGTVCMDATGAGDAFMSGFMYGIFHDSGIDRAIAYGNITGAACVSQRGCLTGYVDEPALRKAWEDFYSESARGSDRPSFGN